MLKPRIEDLPELASNYIENANHNEQGANQHIYETCFLHSIATCDKVISQARRTLINYFNIQS